MTKPSDISLTRSFPPLANALGRAELEHAAALIVRACQLHGDRWQSVAPETVGTTLQHDLKEKIEPFASLQSNPFFLPDVHGLIAQGFARWTGAPGGPCELLPHAIERLKTRGG